MRANWMIKLSMSHVDEAPFELDAMRSLVWLFLGSGMASGGPGFASSPSNAVANPVIALYSLASALWHPWWCFGLMGLKM